MIGPGTTHHLVDAPVQSALRMALLDDRRQLGLTGDRENDIADAPRWFIDRGAGDLDQPALLSIDPLDVFREERKRVVEGKSVSVRSDTGGRGTIQKQKKK